MSEDKKRILINLDYIMPDKTFVYPIYSFDGEKLLEAHEVLTAKKIQMIIEKYGSKVYYFSYDDVSVPSFNNIYDSFVGKTRKMFENILQTGTVTVEDYKNSEDMIAGLIRDLDRKEIEVSDFLSKIENFDDYIFYHAVNASILTAMMLKWQRKNNPDNIRQIVLGAFFSDLGMLQVDKKIIDKPDKLTDDEFSKLRSHPKLGYDILKNIDNVNPIVLQTVLFHHEQLNGEGYYGSPYDTLPYSPKIVQTCNMFDALTSVRPYRQAYSASMAMKMMVNSINSKFDYRLVNDFINGVCPALNDSKAFYRTGDFCILNSSEICLISEVSPADLLRPRVIVFARYEISGKNVTTKFYDNPIEIDLLNDLNRKITSMIIRQELIDVLRNKLIDRKSLVDYLYVSLPGHD